MRKSVLCELSTFFLIHIQEHTHTHTRKWKFIHKTFEWFPAMKKNPSSFSMILSKQESHFKFKWFWIYFPFFADSTWMPTARCCEVVFSFFCALSFSFARELSENFVIFTKKSWNILSTKEKKDEISDYN